MEEEQKNICKLIKMTSLFSAPLIVFFGGLTLILAFSGELAPLPQVIRAQKDSKAQVMMGLAYNNPDSYFKMESVLARNPKIVALGPSRVMQFRSLFFKNPADFYNAGGATEKIEDYSSFLDKIPKGREPEIIIAGLDHNYFNPNANKAEQGVFAQEPKFWGVWQSGITKLLQDYIRGKFSLRDIFSRPADKIGLNALVNNDGFLNDGSYHYTKYIEYPESNPDYRFSDTFLRIDSGTRRFQYSDEVSGGAVLQMEKFLQKAKERNIYVIGFLPPYAHAVYEKMLSMGDKYGYITKLEGELKPLFEEHGFKFYDFSDIESIGASDKETIDGFHGSEKAYVRLFLLMLEKDEVLAKEADKAYLKAMLKSSENDYYVFSY